MRGLAHDGPANGDTLALAAGELARVAIEQAGDAEHGGGGLDARLDLGRGQLPRLQPEADVPGDRHVWIERIVLEHHRDVAVSRPHVVDDLAADLDLTVADILEPGDGAEKRALAAARRPDQHGELAVGNVEVDAAHRLEGAVALVETPDLHVGHFVSVP